MTDLSENICFTVVWDGQEHRIVTQRYAYRSLMALIRDKVCPDDFGDCGGMGRCATCQVSIKGGLNSPVHMQRNEAETLRKAGVSHALARLSCQILITEDLENLFVVVL